MDTTVPNAETDASQDDVKVFDQAVAPEPEKKDPPADAGTPIPDEHGDEEDDADEGTAKRDTELEDAGSAEEQEDIRKRRREERRNRQQRQKSKIESLANQNAALNQQVQQLMETVTGIQQNTVGQQLAQVDREIGNAKLVWQRAQAAEADALTKQDGATAVAAREAGMEARNRFQYLTELKSRATQQLNQPAPLNPEMVAHGRAFAQKHAWFNPRSGDPDSSVLSALDASLSKEGWNPSTPAYWTELENRMGKYLPHRAVQQQQQPAAQQVQQQQQAPRSPVAGAGSGNNGSGNQEGYKLSADRVRAIKEAGAWDDPKRRDALIKRYRDHDAAAKANT